MLAYSSIENLGLLALGAAIGSPLAIAAVLLHILGHGLTKSALFLGAGRMLQLTGTSRIDGTRALMARKPWLAWCFGLGMLAITGFPPFSLFASEVGIVRAGFSAGLGWVTAAAMLLVLVAAAALVGHTSRMLLGAPPADPADPPDPSGARSPAASGPVAVATRRGTPVDGTAVAMIVALTACAALGITLGPLTGLLDQAVSIVSGGSP
jgi:hydrogenase-4 component F